MLAVGMLLAAVGRARMRYRATAWDTPTLLHAVQQCQQLPQLAAAAAAAAPYCSLVVVMAQCGCGMWTLASS